MPRSGDCAGLSTDLVDLFIGLKQNRREGLTRCSHRDQELSVSSLWLKSDLLAFLKFHASELCIIGLSISEWCGEWMFLALSPVNYIIGKLYPTLKAELSPCSMFWSPSSPSWCSAESLTGLKLFPPLHPLTHLYLFPPSHLIASDKCPYWLHIIRCSGGSVRLYYSAHTPHLFSILHGWHTCICKPRVGPRLSLKNCSIFSSSIGNWSSWGFYPY